MVSSILSGDKRNAISLSIYVVGTFSLSWSVWLLAAQIQGPLTIGSLAIAWLAIFLGGSAPSLVAIWLTAWQSGHAGLRLLLEQAMRWRIQPIWYIVALGSPAALATASLWVASLATDGSFSSFHLMHGMPLIAGVIGSLKAPLGEELGWRGYLLPRLQQRYGALGASLGVGGLWAGWHLPLVVLPGTIQSTVPLGLYAVHIVAWSIVFTWLYNQTRGSVLLAFILHGAINFWMNTVPVLPESAGSYMPFVVMTIILCLVAALLARRLWSIGPAGAGCFSVAGSSTS